MRAFRFIAALAVLVLAWFAWRSARPSDPVAGLELQRETAEQPRSPEVLEPSASEVDVQPADEIGSERRVAEESAPLAAVLGRVSFADGSPAPERTIRLFDHSGGAAPVSQRTDEDGNFEFVVEAGVWQLAGDAPAGFVPWRVEVVLDPDDADRADHVLGATESICVRVWRSEGGVVVPAANARVAAVDGLTPSVHRRSWRDGAPPRWSTADGEGRAEMLVAPRRANTLYVEADEHAPLMLDLDLRALAVAALAQGDGCIHVFLDAFGPPIRGRVLSPEGKPVANALVSLSAQHVEPRAFAMSFGSLGARAAELGSFVFASATTPPAAWTDASGRFELRGPRADAPPVTSFALVVHPGREDFPHHFVHELDFASFGRELEVTLRLARGHEHELELVDASGEPYEGPVSVRDPDGRAHAPPGPLLEAQLENSSNEAYFAVVGGRLALRHAGGVVVVNAASNADEDGAAFVTLPRETQPRETRPREGGATPIRVQLAR